MHAHADTTILTVGLIFQENWKAVCPVDCPSPLQKCDTTIPFWLGDGGRPFTTALKTAPFVSFTTFLCLPIFVSDSIIFTSMVSEKDYH